MFAGTQLPYNDAIINCVWGGLWTGLTYTAAVLVALTFTANKYDDPQEKHDYATTMTWVSRARELNGSACAHVWMQLVACAPVCTQIKCSTQTSVVMAELCCFTPPSLLPALSSAGCLVWDLPSCFAWGWSNTAGHSVEEATAQGAVSSACSPHMGH